MAGVSQALERLNGTVGPNGGDLTKHQAIHRNQPLLAAVDSDTGLPLLHTFEDTARMGLRDEKGWHRMAAFMLLAHRTNSEIAAAANVTPSAVGQLRGQRWFQELLAVLANEEGEDVRSVLAAEALASVEKLVAIRDDSQVSARVQLEAAKTLLEHASGKPTQKIISVSAHTSFQNEKEELAEIQRELQNLRNAATT